MNTSRLALIRSFFGLVLLVALLFFPGSALGDSTINGTKVDSFVDSDSDGKAEVGETIEYTITIENTGDEDASDINLQDILDANTDLVTGSVIVAKDDIYETVGNTRLDVDADIGVLANDSDPDGIPPTKTVTHLNGDTVLNGGNSTQGGDVGMALDGSFTYTPPVGFQGNDTFTYNVTDADGSSAVATVSIKVSNMVWYVDNTAGAGDGREALLRPLDRGQLHRETGGAARGPEEGIHYARRRRAERAICAARGAAISAPQ